MVVEPSKVGALSKVFEKWDLNSAAIGTVTDDGNFTITREREILASVPAELLTDKVPVNIRPQSEPAYFKALKKADFSKLKEYGDWTELLEKLLLSPNIASKRWVYEQYDCTVGTNTVVRPGSDAAVMRLPGSKKGMALAVDCNTRYTYLDPWRGGAIAVAESARNVAVSGAKPLAITNCLNFGNPEKPEIYWQFVKATDGVAAACESLNTPVTGGNVSFYNEYDGQAIYPSPTIGMVGVIDDVEKRLTSAFKADGDVVLLAGESFEELGASEAHYILTGKDEGEVPVLDFAKEKALYEFLAEAADKELLSSAHDCADGGLAVALAESAIQGGVGVSLAWEEKGISTAAALFGESQSRAVVSFASKNKDSVEALLKKHSVPFTPLGMTGGEDFSIKLNGEMIISRAVSELARVWDRSIPEIMK
ncbi:hypothetical protein FACS1894204_10630 [Synergistales bacterium]|nr:hypothetical protein FACS1894204_10630 [Synergistales bacterium]